MKANYIKQSTFTHGGVTESNLNGPLVTSDTIHGHLGSEHYKLLTYQRHPVDSTTQGPENRLTINDRSKGRGLEISLSLSHIHGFLDREAQNIFGIGTFGIAKEQHIRVTHLSNACP